VAVKVLTAALRDPESLRRFDRECQALGSLSGHPNIVTLHAAGITADGHPYLIMDYMSGGSLADRLAASGPLGWEESTAIGVKLAGGLAAAHASNILHRDIKPENVLVSLYGEPQLADFGVARIQGGTSSTSTGAITGSLAHSAPEVISGLPATPASDMWSLASTLVTLLAGMPPFSRAGDETLQPLVARILTAPPADLRPLGVPSDLCDLLEAGLTKDSWERIQTAQDFGHALQALQVNLGQPATAMAAPVTSVEGSFAAGAPMTVPVEPLAEEASATRRRAPMEQAPRERPVPIVVPPAERRRLSFRRREKPAPAKLPGVAEAESAVSSDSEALYLRAGRYASNHRRIILPAAAVVLVLGILAFQRLGGSSSPAVALRSTTTTASALAQRSTTSTPSESSSTPTTAVPPTTPTSVPPTAQRGNVVVPPTQTTPAPPSPCHTSDFQARLGQQQGGAGQVYLPIILKNISPRTCIVAGYPGVSLLDASNNQIGSPATRSGGAIGTVQLSPGTEASTLLHTTNVGFGPPCVGPSASIRIYPPGEVASLVAPGSFTACGGFTVQPLVAGTF
jgi:Protein kinase domain/Protein of unknown function (DUF4232)